MKDKKGVDPDGRNWGETISKGRGKHNQIYHIKSILNKIIYVTRKFLYLDSLYRDKKKKLESPEIFPLVLCCTIYG